MKNKNVFKKKNSDNSYLDKISGKGFFWTEKAFNRSDAKKLIDDHDVSMFLATILAGRGINNLNYRKFIDPKLKNSFPNPSLLKDLDRATDEIVNSILKKKKIGIFGDYDVDGATSTSLIGSFLRDLDSPFEYYIPDRIDEGYGPNINALRFLSNKKCELIILVDCGTTANEVIDLAVKEKMKVIIVDHHQQGNLLPKALSTINPNRHDDKSELTNLSAVGVSFFLIVSVNRKLKKLSFYNKIREPNLFGYLDLVALGTVCDVVKLQGLNRTLVKQGLKVINKTRNIGILSLIESSRIEKEIDEYHLGYILGPRINAGGRVGKSSKGVELLLSENKSHAMIVADELSKFNTERQKIEQKVEELAKEKVSLDEDIICVHGSNWHQGVIGIVAGRLVERYSKPTIVISEDQTMCKGSARSFGNLDIGLLIKKAKEENIIENGGGHKMAAGLSIKLANIQLFKSFLEKYNFKKEKKKNRFFEIKLHLSNVNESLYENIKKLSPYGSGNSKPKFCFNNCFVKSPRLVGNNHISCSLSDIYGNSIRAIAFKAFDNGVGEILMESKGKLVNIIGQITMNTWNGNETIQIQIDDAIC